MKNAKIKQSREATLQMQRYMRQQDAVMSKTNTLPIDLNQDYDHLEAKLKVARQMIQGGRVVVVEPQFKESGWPRPDVWVVDYPQGQETLGIEIFKSETLKEFEHKMNRYVQSMIFIRVGYVTVKEVQDLGAEGAISLAMERAEMPKAWLRIFELRSKKESHDGI